MAKITSTVGFTLELSFEEAQALYYAVDPEHYLVVEQPRLQTLARELEELLGEAVGE